MDGRIPGVEEVAAFHKSALGNRDYISDKAALEEEVMRLPEKANEVYCMCLKVIEEFVSN